MRPNRIFADFVVFARGYFRNPIGLFFSLFFPIILISIFGVIFSGGNSPVTIYVVNEDSPSNTSIQFLADLNHTGAVNVEVTSVGNLSQYLADNSYPVGLVIPRGFAAALQNHTPIALTIYGNPSDPTSTGIAESVVGTVGNAYSFKVANSTPVVLLQVRPVGSTLFTSIDYLVPGLIGFAILTSPMFSMVEISASYRKDGLFRQLSLTPLTKGEWLTAKILWYIVLTFISAGVMVGMGVAVFHAHVTLTLGLLPFLVLGPVFFVALGMLAGSLAKTVETAAVIGNVVTFPMMFLSGTFFPVALFPEPWRSVAHYLPLFYVIDGMDKVMLFTNVAGAIPDMLFILVAALLTFVAAVLTFRWRAE